jgi:hypothetical protein
MKSIPSFLPAVALAAAALLPGCATYKLKVDAISRAPSAALAPASYVLRSVEAGADDDCLRYRETEQRIKAALAGRGLWEAPSADSADLVVDIAYGLEAPRVVFTEVHEPVIAPATDVNGQPLFGGEGPVVGFKTVQEPRVVREKRLSVACRENKPGAEGRPAPELWRISVSLENDATDFRGCLPVLAAVAMEQLGTNTDGAAEVEVGAHDDDVNFVTRDR